MMQANRATIIITIGRLWLCMAKNKTKKIIVAGSLVVEAIYDRVERGDSDKVRAAKHKASSEALKRMNRVYSSQKLEFMLAANFVPGDLVVTLTYRDECLPPNRKLADARLKYFRTKLAKVYKSLGQDLRMVWTTESHHGEGRYHHHITINSVGLSYKDIARLWQYGDDVDIKPLKIDKGHSYRSLAIYMCKEEPEHVGCRTWSYTRNCYKPEIETFRVEADTQLQAPKGSTVIEETSERTEYSYYKVIKYLAPNWEQRRVKSRRRRRK